MVAFSEENSPRLLVLWFSGFFWKGKGNGETKIFIDCRKYIFDEVSWRSAAANLPRDGAICRTERRVEFIYSIWVPWGGNSPLCVGGSEHGEDFIRQSKSTQSFLVSIIGCFATLLECSWKWLLMRLVLWGVWRKMKAAYFDKLTNARRLCSC